MRLLLSFSLLAAGLAACTAETTPPEERTCPAADTADAGDLAALKAQRCNVPSSMGAKNWYRLSATLPGATTNVVQVELWPERGSFRGGAVRAGTFQLTGDDLSFATCGVCLRAMADKGGPAQREYFAIAGTVEVTEVSATAGAPFTATIREASFAEVSDKHVEVSDGCSVDLARAKISGPLMVMGGTGGGGGGGGSGGMGGCLTTVGD
jgi:hypothetical protein